MSKCKKTVETGTGIFTFHDELVSRGAAKLKCAKNGEILAPLTNQADIQALIDTVTSTSCPFPYGEQSKHLTFILFV